MNQEKLKIIFIKNFNTFYDKVSEKQPITLKSSVDILNKTLQKIHITLEEFPDKLLIESILLQDLENNQSAKLIVKALDPLKIGVTYDNKDIKDIIMKKAKDLYLSSDQLQFITVPFEEIMEEYFLDSEAISSKIVPLKYIIQGQNVIPVEALDSDTIFEKFEPEISDFIEAFVE